MMKNTHIRNRGFSLIEVLIAVVIMSVGLLALATLQLGIIRSSAEAKAQTLAVNIARDKLEDLTSYRIVNEATGVSCPSANDSYQCITSAAAAESLNDDGNGSYGGVNYSRTWTVDRCTGAVGGTFTCGQANTSAWTGSTPRNEFKNMTVTVSWTDATSGPQSVAVKNAVGAIDPSDIALIQKLFTPLTPKSAQGKIWDPGTVSGVIPIAVGAGTSSAATNPKPEVIAGNSVVETRFDVLTYSGLNSGTADAQARVETAVVGCSCKFATLASTARGLRPAYWNGVRYVVPVPTSAAPPATVGTGVTQSDKCDICCRDHHDPAGTVTAKFSPYVTTHDHFNAYAVGTLAATAGQAYKEACRLIRVDGIFRVAPDLTDDYFALLATKDLTSSNAKADSPIPDPTSTISYQNFVIDYMNDRFTRKANPAATASLATNALYNTYHSTTPCISGSCTLEGQDLAGVARTPTLNKPDFINLASGDIKWNHSRGLFVDYLEPEAIQTIVNAKTNCGSQTTTSIAFSDCILKYLPFTSINLTEIADWNSGGSTVQATVTNNDYGESTAVTAIDPVRGKVVWGTAPTNNTSVNIYTVARKSNSSLLDLSFDAISPADALSYADFQVFTIQGTPANPGVNGDFKVNLAGISGSVPAVRYITGVKSSQPCVAGNGGNFLNNNCPVTNATSGSGLTIANSMKVVAQKYNAQVDGNNNSGTTTAGQFSCYDAGGTTPLPVPAGENFTPHSCLNYAVSSATLVSSLSVAGLPGVPASSVSDGTLSESTTISFPLINVGDVITVNFTLTATTSPGFTCSYVPKNPSGYNYTVVQGNCTP